MNFLEFWSKHFAQLTIMFFVMAIIIIVFIYKLLKLKKVKTPWFEIAPESVKDVESEDMGKTRLLLKRQFEYVNNYIDGISNIFLALEKNLIDSAMESLFNNNSESKTYMKTCLINSDTNELIQSLKNYINGLLVMNHIGTDKEKIIKYAKLHVSQVVGIVKKHTCDIYSQLSGTICTDTVKYWKQIGIDDPTEWAETHLVEVLIGISELRYSDFDMQKKNEKQ